MAVTNDVATWRSITPIKAANRTYCSGAPFGAAGGGSARC